MSESNSINEKRVCRVCAWDENISPDMLCYSCDKETKKSVYLSKMQILTSAGFTEDQAHAILEVID